MKTNKNSKTTMYKFQVEVEVAVQVENKNGLKYLEIKKGIATLWRETSEQVEEALVEKYNSSLKAYSFQPVTASRTF